MRILVFGINYSPELTGIGKYTGEMCAWLAKQGHSVSIATAIPYYPEWEVHEKYRSSLWVTEDLEGVEVIRCPLYVPKKVTSFKRIVHEFSFLASLFPVWLQLIFRKKYDLVIGICPPFHLGILPLVYSKIKGSKLLLHIQDLQVDAAKDLGMIQNKTALRLMFSMEKYLLSKSCAISTISSGMKKKISSKGINSSKILLFPNWVDDTVIRPLSRVESLRVQFGIAEYKKVVLYSGNLGEKQGLEKIVEVANNLRGNKDLVFVIVGSGGGKEELVKLVERSNLSNVLFFPLQPYSKLSALLAIADVHLVLQKKSASDLVMPSKLTAILASGGCPIVTAMPGTSLFDIIYEHNLGILVEPESTMALQEGINTALNSDLSTYKKNARRYSEEFLSKEAILKKFESDIAKII
jgi:colanic acid biosynthesis glycosyl transferase WcaI